MNAKLVPGRLGKGLQQILAVFLVVLVVAAIWALYAGIASKIASNDEAISERRVQLGRMLQIAEWKPEIGTVADKQLDTVLQTLFSPGDASAVSMAEFQARLKRHAASAGAQIVNVTERPVKEELGFSWIGLRIAVIGRFDAVARFVAAVETGTPYTTVFSGRVTADPDPNRVTTPDARLDVQLEIYSPVRAVVPGQQ
ncbi:type II secretion system protein GspM [Anderseniella sp. Alg231-50]|uniref:type II secretion system protein GspM n=1 Tax=Anderseniella sp. Alg231-50 TaxID=1922226 RepID=UPI000D54BC07